MIVNNIAGAEKALASGEADFFMWEKFTTKPWVDKQVFKRIGECPTPWPCFVLVASAKFIASNPETIKALSAAILASVNDFLSNADKIEEIASLYHLQKEDIAEWIKTVTWASDNHIEPTIIEKVISTLDGLGQLGSKIEVGDCL